MNPPSLAEAEESAIIHVLCFEGCDALLKIGDRSVMWLAARVGLPECRDAPSTMATTARTKASLFIHFSLSKRRLDPAK